MKIYGLKVEIEDDCVRITDEMGRVRYASKNKESLSETIVANKKYKNKMIRRILNAFCKQKPN